MRVIALLALIPAFAAASGSLKLDRRQAGLPSCAVQCLSSLSTSCSTGDIGCYCQSSDVISQLTSCLPTVCSGDDLTSAASAAQALCAAQGVTTTFPVPSATGSASAAESASSGSASASASGAESSAEASGSGSATSGAGGAATSGASATSAATSGASATSHAATSAATSGGGSLASSAASAAASATGAAKPAAVAGKGIVAGALLLAGGLVAL